MKLSTRIKISYIFSFVVPVFLILAMVFGFISYSMNSLRKKYDIDEYSYQMLTDPLQMMSHVASTANRQLKKTAEEDPDQLADKEYLDEIDSNLKKYYSCLIVRKEGEIIYSSLPKESRYETSFDRKGGTGSIYVMDEHPYHVQMMSFRFSDGKEGEAFIYTNVDQIAPQSQQALINIALGTVFILFVVSALLMVWLYRGIIRPIGKLKNAAETITAGNLNVSVTAESDDEIGELSNALNSRGRSSRIFSMKKTAKS